MRCHKRGAVVQRYGEFLRWVTLATENLRALSFCFLNQFPQILHLLMVSDYFFAGVSSHVTPNFLPSVLMLLGS